MLSFLSLFSIPVLAVIILIDYLGNDIPSKPLSKYRSSVFGPPSVACWKLATSSGVIASSQCMHGGHSLDGQVTLRSMPRHFVVGGARNGWIAWCSSPPSFLPINPWRMGVADAKNGRAPVPGEFSPAGAAGWLRNEASGAADNSRCFVLLVPAFADARRRAYATPSPQPPGWVRRSRRPGSPPSPAWLRPPGPAADRRGLGQE